MDQRRVSIVSKHCLPLKTEGSTKEIDRGGRIDIAQQGINDCFGMGRLLYVGYSESNLPAQTSAPLNSAQRLPMTSTVNVSGTGAGWGWGCSVVAASGGPNSDVTK